MFQAIITHGFQLRRICGIALLLFFGVYAHTSHAQIITTFAGTGYTGFNGDNIPATDANISSPRGLATDAQGNIYVAANGEYRIRKIDVNGTITTIAGDGTYGFSGDGGPAINAQLSVFVYGMFIDPQGNLYFCDHSNNRVRKVDTHGIITTVAGTGEPGYGGDGGPATAARLWGPRSVCLDANGNIYIADSGNDRIRKIDLSGAISTIAGTGEAGYNGEGVTATAAKLNTPVAVAMDNYGNIHIADLVNKRIRKIDHAGIISTVAGCGIAGSEGDGGSATAAKFKAAHDLKFDKNNNFYFPDPGMNRVRKVTTEGFISTIVGSGSGFFEGDGGPATSAGLGAPNALAPDASGNLFIADFTSSRIRKVSNVVAVTDVNASTSDLSVLPNPNNGSFSVVLPLHVTCTRVQVFDVLGRQVTVQQRVSDNEVNVDIDVPAGQYVLVSTIDGAVYRTVISVVR